MTSPKRTFEGPVTTNALGQLLRETNSWEIDGRCLFVLAIWGSSSLRLKPVMDSMRLGVPSLPSRIEGALHDGGLNGGDGHCLLTSEVGIK